MKHEPDNDEREVTECIEQAPDAIGISKIDQFRNIVHSHTMQKIDGVAVDVMTANAIVTVYDGLNSRKYQEMFMGFPVSQMATIAWKLIK